MLALRTVTYCTENEETPSQNNVHMFLNQCFDTEEEAIAAGLEWLSTQPPESIKGP